MRVLLQILFRILQVAVVDIVVSGAAKAARATAKKAEDGADPEAAATRNAYNTRDNLTESEKRAIHRGATLDPVKMSKNEKDLKKGEKEHKDNFYERMYGRKEQENKFEEVKEEAKKYHEVEYNFYKVITEKGENQQKNKEEVKKHHEKVLKKLEEIVDRVNEILDKFIDETSNLQNNNQNNQTGNDRQEGGEYSRLQHAFLNVRQIEEVRGIAKETAKGAAKGAAKGFLTGGVKGSIKGTAEGMVKGIIKGSEKHGISRSFDPVSGKLHGGKTEPFDPGKSMAKEGAHKATEIFKKADEFVDELLRMKDQLSNQSHRSGMGSKINKISDKIGQMSDATLEKVMTAISGDMPQLGGNGGFPLKGMLDENVGGIKHDFRGIERGVGVLMKLEGKVANGGGEGRIGVLMKLEGKVANGGGEGRIGVLMKLEGKVANGGGEGRIGVLMKLEGQVAHREDRGRGRVAGLDHHLRKNRRVGDLMKPHQEGEENTREQQGHGEKFGRKVGGKAGEKAGGVVGGEVGGMVGGVAGPEGRVIGKVAGKVGGKVIGREVGEAVGGAAGKVFDELGAQLTDGKKSTSKGKGTIESLMKPHQEGKENTREQQGHGEKFGRKVGGKAGEKAGGVVGGEVGGMVGGVAGPEGRVIGKVAGKVGGKVIGREVGGAVGGAAGKVFDELGAQLTDGKKSTSKGINGKTSSEKHGINESKREISALENSGRLIKTDALPVYSKEVPEGHRIVEKGLEDRELAHHEKNLLEGEYRNGNAENINTEKDNFVNGIIKDLEQKLGIKKGEVREEARELLEKVYDVAKISNEDVEKISKGAKKTIARWLDRQNIPDPYREGKTMVDQEASERLNVPVS